MNTIIRVTKTIPYLGGLCNAEEQVQETGDPAADGVLLWEAAQRLKAQVNAESASRLAAAGVTLDENGRRVEPTEPPSSDE